MTDTKEKLSTATIWLHWLVGITIIVMLTVGVYMKETETEALYSIHKSIGILIFAVILIRAAWRIKNGWPEPVGHYEKFEQILSKIIHWVLIVGTLVMPASGMMMSGAGGHGFGIFGLELMAPNPDPTNLDQVIPLNETLAELGHEMHEIVGYLLIVAVILHISGALKRYFINKDGTLQRMLGARL